MREKLLESEMPHMEYSMIKQLSQWLSQYARIYLFPPAGRELLSALNDFAQKFRSDRKSLLLGTAEIPPAPGFDYRRLTEHEMQELLSLYYLYSFSDRFLVISEQPQFGSLNNYVTAGLLTREEMMEAFLF